MCVNGELIGTHVSAIEWAYPQPQSPTPGSPKFPFQIAAKRLDIDENVNRARLFGHFLALNICFEHRTAFAKVTNE